jgi:ABC-type multidrug transport system fused ATPase/permease subunit
MAGKKVLFYCFAASSLFIIAIYVASFYFNLDPDKVVKFYQVNIRGSLFAGFLTLGGFLLSLKTFIIVKLKENVYDHDEYEKRFERQSKLNSKLVFYAPLKNLSNFLFWTVVSCIGAAILQLTLGLFNSFYTTLIAVMAALFALSVLMYSLYLIKLCLNDWFEFLDMARKVKLKENNESRKQNAAD